MNNKNTAAALKTGTIVIVRSDDSATEQGLAAVLADLQGTFEGIAALSFDDDGIRVEMTEDGVELGFDVYDVLFGFSDLVAKCQNRGWMDRGVRHG